MKNETLEEAAMQVTQKNRVGQFPIEYAREQVVKHTGDFDRRC
jgi:hypothetical protein